MFDLHSEIAVEERSKPPLEDSSKPTKRQERVFTSPLGNGNVQSESIAPPLLGAAPASAEKMRSPVEMMERTPCENASQVDRCDIEFEKPFSPQFCPASSSASRSKVPDRESTNVFESGARRSPAPSSKSSRNEAAVSVAKRKERKKSSNQPKRKTRSAAERVVAKREKQFFAGVLLKCPFWANLVKEFQKVSIYAVFSHTL